MENNDTAVTATVQHVTKASSDQLLRKFSEVGCDSDDRLSAKKELRLIKRRKTVEITKGGGRDESKCLNNISTALVERKALLPQANSWSSGALIRRLRIGRAKGRGREFKTKSMMSTIEKTWRKAVDGASKVFTEKHYNRHKRLINDIY